MLAILAASILALAQGAPSAPPLPPLPDGRLLLFAGNAASANFWVMDQTAKSGSKVDVWFFRVHAEPYNLTGNDPNRRVSQEMANISFDCAKRDSFVSLSDHGFNETGERIVWLPREAPEPLKPDSTQDFLARVVCDGMRPPGGDANIVTGHATAVKIARQILAQQKR